MRALTSETAKLFRKLSLSSADRLKLSLTRDGNAFVARIYQSAPDGQDAFPSIHACRTFVGRIPERKKRTYVPGIVGDVWEFAATDLTVSIIQAVWEPSQIEFENGAAIVYQYLLAELAAQHQNAERCATYKLKKEVPQHSLELHKKYPLADYQQVAACNLGHSEGYALLMEQGTGKTPIVIAHVCNDAKRVYTKETRMYRAIIVAPNNVRLNWKNEFEKFSTTPGIVTVLRGGQIRRAKLLIDAVNAPKGSQYTVVITSYETLCVSWDLLKMFEWDIAVLDESHSIKSPSTRRFKFACKLRDRARKRVILTGTAISNSILDLYAQLEFLGKGKSGFISWKNFRTFYSRFRTDASGHQAIVGAQRLPFIQEKLARLAFLISKKEALPDLPEKVYDVCEVEMGPRQSELYKELAQHLAIEIENDLQHGSHKQLVVKNVLVKLLRLAQITSGFITWDAQFSDNGEEIRPKQVERLADSPKIAATLKLIEEAAPNEKVIVWACWVSDIQALVKAICAIGIKCVSFYNETSEKDRELAEYNYNHDPEVKVWIGSPAAGGVGLNLLGYPPTQSENYTTNTAHEIYFSQNWSPIARSQSEDRPHRRGTRINVRITDLCVPGTIDEEIRTRVLQKKMSAMKATDIQSILINVLKGAV